MKIMEYEEKYMLKKTKGFTVVEVAVVLVILAILAGITIPTVSGWVKDSSERRLISEAKIAVKTSEGIIAKLYAKDKVVAFSGVDVIEKSGLDGVVTSIEVGGTNTNKLLHLSYSNYGDTVTYCASHNGSGKSDECSDTDHPKTYNFIEGKSYSWGEPEEEVKEPETSPPAVTPPATTPGDDDDEEETIPSDTDKGLGFFLKPDMTVWVKSEGNFSEILKNNNENPNVWGFQVTGIYYYKGTYYYLKDYQYIQNNATEAAFDNLINKGYAVAINIDKPPIEYGASNVVAGDICNFNGVWKVYTPYKGGGTPWTNTGWWKELETFDVPH